MPSISLRRLLLPGLLIGCLAGCSTTNKACFDDQDYTRAVDRPRLRMPEGVQASERLAAITIPAAATDAAKLDPAPGCIDEPPSFFGRKGAVTDSAEAAVNAWAAAWADGKVEAVVQMYSPAFQATGEGGSAAFLDQRRQQVESGRSPAARLEDMDVETVGADRRIVSFVQRFGNDRVRKELTLVREPQGWRIVSEQTREVL